MAIDLLFSEEEEPDDYPFPLTLKMKKGSGPNSPAPLLGPPTEEKEHTKK